MVCLISDCLFTVKSFVRWMPVLLVLITYWAWFDLLPSNICLWSVVVSGSFVVTSI